MDGGRKDMKLAENRARWGNTSRREKNHNHFILLCTVFYRIYSYPNHSN